MTRTIHIRIGGDAPGKVADMIRRAGDLRPAMNEIGEIVQASIIRNFEDSGRPRWQSLRPSTIEARKKQNKWPGQILVRTGNLKRIHYKATKQKVTVSPSAQASKYAALHQFGARAGSFGTVAARVKRHLRSNIRTKSGTLKWGEYINSRLHGRKDAGKVWVKAHTRMVRLPWGDIPARPFMLVQDEDVADMTEAISDYLIGAGLS